MPKRITMPPKKRKAEAAPADDGGVDSSGGGTTPATKKSKKDAAAEARARAKAWRDGRRQQQQQSSAAKTTVATTPSSPTVVHAVTTAPFSTGKKSPKKAASSTTSPKRRRTPVKRAAAATTPGSTRKKSTATSSTATSPSSSQQQPAKKSRHTVVPTNFQFDETAVVEKQATFTTTTTEENELLPTSPNSDKKRKKQEGRARIENLRKKRQQSGLKVASPPENDDTNMIMAEETTTFTTKTLTVTPGKIGLSLTVDLAKGGATVTRVDPTSRFIGQIHVGDVITKIDGRLIKTVEDVHVNAEKIRLFQIVSGGGEQEEEVDMAAAAAGGEDPPVLASATSKTAVDPPPSSSSSSLAPAVTAKRQAVSSSQKPELPAAVASIFSQQTPSTTAHRPDATAKYNPNQPFPTQGYKLSTAAYCGCGPTPSNTTTATTKVGRSGSGTLQQLRESMRNAPAVKRASEGEDDEKMAARPSPPGKVGSELAATAAESTAPPSAVEPTEVVDEEENAGILKASISRAQQLVSSVAFANRQRRVKLGIKSDLTETDSASPVMERGSEKLISPSVDPPGGNAPVVEKTGEDVRAEESALDEVYDEEIPRVSVVRKVMKGIYTLLKWASILPLAIGVLYLLSSLRGDTSVAQLDSKAAKDDVVSPACFMDYPSDFYFAGENVTGDDGCGGNYIQCPQWGRCHGGALRDCEDGGGGEWQGLVRFVPNEGGTACVPSDPALMIMKIVQDALVNMTVAQSCRTSDMITDPASVLLVEQEPYPLFSLDVVSWAVNKASEVDITMSAELLLWLQPVFETKLVSFGQLSETDDVPNAIGLSSEVPEHKLPVPLSCQMKFIFMELFGWLLKLLYRVIVLLMQKLWQYISTYPKSSPVMLMLLVGVVTIRRKKKHRAKVREIFDVVKEEAYDRLAHSDGSGGYAALHLRDDVGHAMYPSNVRERLFMYSYVWPKLIIEVRADNRVRKFRKAADGKQLEHWDLNTNSKRGWQMRKTPNKTPAKTVETMPSAKKRDP